MKRIVLHLVMLLALFSGATSADALVMPDQCQMGTGLMTDAIHAEASNCDESSQVCDPICVVEARIFPALYLSVHWGNETSNIQLEPYSERVRSGYPSSVYHPPQA
jgi:hypothetical protein